MVTKTDQLLKEFINLHPKFIDLSLNRLENLLKKLGNPHKNLPPTIHIAGTNGKGSTLSFIKNILENNNYSVHTYTSPHLEKFSERIDINNKKVSGNKLLKILHTLVDEGNTVIVIEHNLDVIKTADYIIDMGPDGGVKGGNIIAAGKPEEISQVKTSYTGQFLKTMLNNKFKKIA